MNKIARTGLVACVATVFAVQGVLAQSAEAETTAPVVKTIVTSNSVIKVVTCEPTVKVITVGPDGTTSTSSSGDLTGLVDILKGLGGNSGCCDLSKILGQATNSSCSSGVQIITLGSGGTSVSGSQDMSGLADILKTLAANSNITQLIQQAVGGAQNPQNANASTQVSVGKPTVKVITLGGGSAQDSDDLVKAITEAVSKIVADKAAIEPTKKAVTAEAQATKEENAKDEKEGK